MRRAPAIHRRFAKSHAPDQLAERSSRHLACCDPGSVRGPEVVLTGGPSVVSRMSGTTANCRRAQTVGDAKAWGPAAETTQCSFPLGADRPCRSSSRCGVHRDSACRSSISPHASRLCGTIARFSRVRCSSQSSVAARPAGLTSQNGSWSSAVIHLFRTYKQGVGGSSPPAPTPSSRSALFPGAARRCCSTLVPSACHIRATETRCSETLSGARCQRRRYAIGYVCPTPDRRATRRVLVMPRW